MNWRYKLLQIDSFGGLSVGLLMLLLSYWLSGWYGLPRGFIIFIALANIAYGCYSFSLLRRVKRPLSLVVVLVVANLCWAVLCVLWAAIYAQSASPLGTIHLLGEAVFVGGLACLEWRYREFLLTKLPHEEKNTAAEL